MRITHVAVWTNELERSRSFYTHYFGGRSSEKYENPVKGFASYFVTFERGTALEIMQRKDITVHGGSKETIGLAHFAFSVENRERVHEMIELFRNDGYQVLGEPRLTGDGFYEGVIEDPDGNRVEIVAE